MRFLIDGKCCSLSGEQINLLKSQGATQCRYGVSENPQYLGDITCVYFLNEDLREIAIITGISVALILSSRYWHNFNNYHRSELFEKVPQDEINPSEYYRII